MLFMYVGKMRRDVSKRVNGFFLYYISCAIVVYFLFRTLSMRRYHPGMTSLETIPEKIDIFLQPTVYLVPSLNHLSSNELAYRPK
uniref:Uncharacterized protein n=1 Tax=Romanomermis culicivorax TaxID=13658 RepID=A0A915HZY5_ROMCU